VGQGWRRSGDGLPAGCRQAAALAGCAIFTSVSDQRRGLSHGSWTVAAPAVALAVVGAMLSARNLWRYVGIDAPIQWMDLRAVTDAAACAMDGQWSFDGPSCDVLGRPLNYPSMWVHAVAAMGWGGSEGQFLGWVLMACSVMAVGLVAWLLAQGTRPVWLVGGLTLAAVSPPMLLMINRGNIDQFVFFLAAISAALLVLGRPSPSAIVMGVATGLKLFPIGSVCGLLLFGRSARRALPIFVVVTAITVAPTVDELVQISERTPLAGLSSFGAATLPFALLDPFLSVSWQFRLVGLVSAAGVTVLIGAALRLPALSRLKGQLDALAEGLRTDDGCLAVWGTFFGTFAVAYLAGTNWDYRLVFVIPLVGVAGRLADSGSAGGKVVVGVLVVQLWAAFSYRLPAAVQAASDLLWMALFALGVIVTIRARRSGPQMRVQGQAAVTT
jgi:hypothetical protein